ncbi:lipase maturation factor family protein [Rubellicoccus peritrichatus]|uniref:Lipase maturation factor family protein n=1 Tax=Rubellicoccus peritrichatus TaxID=3080537 RepID=A0AAQ3QUI2_9BACT|nr:lipase maturation factor family protein [Puniceicoccus sp. CR14]WOO39960.1 lipase maturation factor family protein [Puniceicoccus sp. CR14]
MNSKVHVASPPRVKPWMIWDGDCHFCGKWIKRWDQATAGEVEYHRYQDVAERFPEIGEERFSKAVHFIGLDGVAVSGAEAVFSCLEFAGRYRFLLGFYRRFKGFAKLSEHAYTLVANQRMFFSFITRMLWGNSVEYSTFRFSGSIFAKLMGLVYLIAFVSFEIQSAGLIGSNGILPVSDHLSAIERYAEQSPNNMSGWRLAPSLLWLDSSDAALNGLAWVGAAFSLLLILGLLPGFSALVCWLLYLSLVNVVPVFLSFQWDILLLEAGFLTILLAPWSFREKLSNPRDPPTIARWLVWWLIFRLMFESGIVKLIIPGLENNTWSDLTALNFHYFTQPIPNNRSWFFHWFPEIFQQASIVVMFFIELVVPFLIIGPRRVRMIACSLLILLQVLIIASGNYGFFNLLTISLCILLIDDQSLPQRIRGWLRPESKISHWQETLAPIGWIRVPVAVIFVFFGIIQLAASANLYDLRDKLTTEKPPAWAPFYILIQRYHLLNQYGLFRVMTTERPEIVIEGSSDGKTWQPYEFKYKIGALDEAPSWVTPHMPRLDWQMWFAALNVERTGRYPHWFVGFLQALAENREPVIDLLAENPFANEPPEFFRINLYDYRFSTPEEKTQTGNWWQRKLVPNGTTTIPREQLLENRNR